MNSFQFNATDVFGLHNSGIVFRGRIVSGGVAQGERVKLRTKDGDVTAKVTFITEQLSRARIPKTVPGQELNLLLADFDREEINRVIRSAGCDECDPSEALPPLELLNIELPFTLVGAGG